MRIVVILLLVATAHAGQLHDLVRTGDLDALREALQQDTSEVNYTDLSGLTPLHWAVREDRADIAELLLFHKADVNAPGEGEDAGTPLMIAVWMGRDAIVEALISNGADVDKRNGCG